MIRLTRVELKRLVARRVTWVLLLGGFALSSLVLVGIHDQTKYMTPENQAVAQQDFDRIHADWVKNHEREEKACRADLSEDERASADEFCEIPEPLREHFGAGLDVQMPFREASTVLMPMVGFVTFLLGASFVAAEFSTRSIATWLSFEPRRGLVAASKLSAAVIGAAVIGVVLLTYAGAGIWVLCSRVGLTDGVSKDIVLDILSMWTRIPVVAALAGLIGAGTALLLRHTSAALGVLVAYAVGAEGMIRGLIPTWQQWLVSSNATAFVRGEHRYEEFTCDENGCQGTSQLITFAQGSTYLLVLAVVVTAVAVLSFRRRDVT